MDPSSLSANAASDSTNPARSELYAGFWRRFMALLIDYVIVSFICVPISILGYSLAPNEFAVESPLGLFTTSRVLEETPPDYLSNEGDKSVKLVQKTHFGIWTYTYKEESERGRQFNTKEHTKRTIIDPSTQMELDLIDLDDLTGLVLFFYWIILEASGMQGSFGKRALGLKVVGNNGERLTLLRSFGRNASKFFSAIILFIGFMMAGWTDRKQALHDKIAGCLVLREG